MTICPAQVGTHRIRAPAEDGGVLMEPPPDAVEAMVAENVRLRAGYDYDFQGRTLAQLSQQARQELLAAARRWTAAYRPLDGIADSPEGLVFLAGHQPELFHPGVWLKNFTLGMLARRHGAAAVNLIVDSDTAKTVAVRVPGGSPARPQVENIPFDRPGPRVPYEERRIEDRELFADFGQRVARQIKPLVADPLAGQYWPLVCHRLRETDNQGACLAQARHQLEGNWGLNTLEVPQSWVCQAESFSWFVAHLLAELPRFRAVYNQAVQEYRRANRIRNPAHPVPDLAAEGDWREAPLWMWTAADPRRRKVFARPSGRETVLSDRQSLEIRLPLVSGGEARAAAEQLVELGRQGVKIRSRALITTLWARLVLGDLFLHGIGGAKYDQVTDVLLERFFGLEPPGFMVVSATLHLPVPRQRVTVEQDRAIRRQLRELTFHPEKHAASGAAAADGPSPRALIGAKERWIATPPTPANARQRRRAIREINEALQPWVAAERRQLVARQEEMARALQAERILSSREYAFCLYPEGTLRKFLGALLPNRA